MNFTSNRKRVNPYIPITDSKPVKRLKLDENFTPAKVPK